MARQTKRSRLAVGLAAGAVALGGLVLGPVGAATPSYADDSVTGTTCTVDSAELHWGLKASFRNYISGSIANGEWTTENGASYETPAFTWTDGTGSFDEGLESGSVAFTGDVRFTGHSGLMRLDISNPEIVFTGADSAQLVLDIGSADTAEAEIVQERLAIAKVDLSGYETVDGSTLAIANAAVRLTAEGAEALNGAFGDYVSGQEMDPLALNLAVSDCSLAASTGKQEPAAEAPPSHEEIGDDMFVEDAGQIPWVPIVIGGAALVIVGVTAGMLIAGRKKDAAVATPADPPADTDL